MSIIFGFPSKRKDFPLLEPPHDQAEVPIKLDLPITETIKEEVLFVAETEEYFRGIQELLEGIEDSCADRPLYCYGCDRAYGYMPAAYEIVRAAFENFDTRAWWLGVTAEDLAENYLIDCYADCDDDYPSEPAECVGVSDLQDAIDRFLLWNVPIYKALGWCKWFHPSRHAIGLRALEKALRSFVDDNNKSHYTFRASYKRVYSLEAAA